MMMLVAIASRHGSTNEIGRAIAEELRATGLVVEQRDFADVRDLQGYDAAVLGSAVYMGNWLSAARHFVDRHAARLAAMPVWLFSSGPIGEDDPQPHGDPVGVAALEEAIHPRGHRVFAGKLDPHELGFMERLAAKAVHAPAGDFRDWDAVRAWAREIAAALGHPAAAGRRS